MLRRRIATITLVLSLSGCGADAVEVAIPEGATFCSVFDNEYRGALDAAVPITDSAFGERIGEILAWAEVLVDLAPDEIAREASDNLEYHRAQAAVESAAAYIPGSNAMHAWASETCP